MIINRNNSNFKVCSTNIEFWETFNNGNWEKETFKILEDNISQTDIIVDIGAWIGPISLYLANKVKQCYAFEPDPTAYLVLKENLKLNTNNIKNVKIFNKAITADGNDIDLFSRFSFGDSGSSILERVKSTNIMIKAKSRSFSSFVISEKIKQLDFIKIDIEGGEFFILPSMKKEIQYFKPTMLVSFHYNALVEYYFKKILPLGIIRRIYRFLNLKFIHKRAKSKMIETVESLECNNITDQNGNLINTSRLQNMNLSEIDMLLFKWS